MFILGLIVGAAAGGAAVWFWPTVKAWFSDEAAVIAGVVKAHI